MAVEITVVGRYVNVYNTVTGTTGVFHRGRDIVEATSESVLRFFTQPNVNVGLLVNVSEITVPDSYETANAALAVLLTDAYFDGVFFDGDVTIVGSDPQLALDETLTDGSQIAQIYSGDTAIARTGTSLNVNITGGSVSGSTLIAGELDNGDPINIAATQEGHLEVAIHEPLLPFGSVHTESLTPVFQTDAVYGINQMIVNTGSTLTGSATAADSNFVLQTGTTAFSQAYLQSRKRLRYRPGQGVVARYTAAYTAGVANSYQVAGVGHAEDGFYFGYVGTDFGVLWTRRGAREVRTLTITVASTTAENVTVTLNGVATLVAVTNSGNIQRTVWEISQGTYVGWTAYPSNSTTVTFVKNDAGAAAGAYTLAGTTATGTFAQNRVGVAATETFIAQADWNGDKLDGTGASGTTAVWTNGNVFQIGVQYLGYGAVTFQVETTSPNNNVTWATVHTLRLPNTLTTTSVRNPCFPFTAAVYSAGSTTNLTLKVASFAGFIEGGKYMRGVRMSYYGQSSAVTDAAYRALFTVLNTKYFGGIASQVVVNLVSVSAALKHINPCILYLVKGGTLAGNPNFQPFATTSSTVWDTQATTITWATNDQVVWSGHLGDTSEIDHHFNTQFEETTLQPGEYVTLAARSVQGNPAWVTGSLNTREDQ